MLDINQVRAWDVYKYGNHIITVYCNATYSPDQVRDDLIEHHAYPSDIVVTLNKD